MNLDIPILVRISLIEHQEQLSSPLLEKARKGVNDGKQNSQMVRTPLNKVW